MFSSPQLINMLSLVSMYLHELNTFDKRLVEKQTYVISLGSVEQHGPFGPIGTDYLIQTELIKRVEKQLPNIIFLPVIPFGPCWQQLGFNGTVSLQESTLYAIITDIVESLKGKANIILFVSWHGGNKPIINKFLSENTQNYPDIRIDHITFGDEGTDVVAEELLGGPTDDHAGNTEIALMLAINPAITKQPQTYNNKKPNSDFDWDRRIVDVQKDGVIDTHPKWVATQEIGEKLLDIYSTNLVTKIQNILTY